VWIVSASTATFNKKRGIVKKFFTLQVRAASLLTSLNEFFLKKRLAPLPCHALRFMLENVDFSERMNDEFDNKKNHCVGIDWDHFPFGQYLGGGELDQ
jgi:hypothetical protein